MDFAFYKGKHRDEMRPQKGRRRGRGSGVSANNSRMDVSPCSRAIMRGVVPS